MTRTTGSTPHGCRTLVIACALALFALPAVADARLGDLDPSFDGDGIATPDIGAQGTLRAVARQPDGAVVAGGSADDAASQPAMAVLRLTPSGVLDGSFGGTGLVRLPGNIEDGAIAAVALESDGNILAAGGTSAGSIATTPDARLFRIGPTGIPTAVALQLPTQAINSFLTGIAVQPDGKIVLGGWATIALAATYDQFMAVRLLPSGAPDQTFGVNGVAFADFGVSNPVRAAALTVDAAGRVTLVGQTSGVQAAAARFTTTGAPDTTFDGDGQVLMTFPVPFQGASRLLGAATHGDGLLATGSFAAGTHGLLQRFLSDGSGDPSHGIAGLSGAAAWQSGGQTAGEAVAATANGGAVVAGRTGTGNVASLQTAWSGPSGALEASGGGLLRTQPVALAPAGPPVGLARTPGDGAVVAGTTPAQTPVLVRLQPNAAPIAVLAAPAQVAPGAPVALDAGGSSDPEGEALRYAFDLDGNGSFELDSGANPVALHSFTAPGARTVGVRVTDPRGASAVTTRAIAVTAAVPPPPRPVLGKQGVARPLRGIVRFRLPGTRRFVRLVELTAIPNGTEIDARNGRVLITVARNAKGRLDSARFYAGRFVFRQAKGPRPITTLKLSGGTPTACGATRASAAAVRGGAKLATAAATPGARLASAAAVRGGKKRVRKLWGDGRGRFRMRGRYGAATVRGTKWLTRDRCDGTLVRVVRGTVSVLDLAPPSAPSPIREGGGGGDSGGGVTIVKAGERTLVRAGRGR